MILYLLAAAATVGLASLITNKKYNLAPKAEIARWQMLDGAVLLALFVILFVVEASRQNVGNDYAKYVEFMHLVVSHAYVPTEVGFNWIVKILYGISGFENHLLVFAFFSFATIAFFLAAIYKQSVNFFFSFFLFMAFGYYFQSFSTVRYYLAVAIAVYGISYVLRKEWIKFLLLILLGASFHKSLLVVIPLYLLASLPWKKWGLALGALFSSTFFFLQDFYLRILLLLYPTYQDTEYLEGGTSYVNIARCGGVLVLALLYYPSAVKGNRRNQFYFYCNLGALVLYTCCSFLPVISRVGYYLMVTHIFFLPSLIGAIENRKQRIFFTSAIAGAAILYFAIYMMRAGADGVRILPYQTFLFHDMPLILSDVT